jgi:hypothetical protein
MGEIAAGSAQAFPFHTMGTLLSSLNSGLWEVKLLLDQLKPSHSARWARYYQASTTASGNTVFLFFSCTIRIYFSYLP